MMRNWRRVGCREALDTSRHHVSPGVRSRGKLDLPAALPAPFAWVIRGRIFLIGG